MKTIELAEGISVVFDPEVPGAAKIITPPDLYEVCPKCNQRDCIWSCDQSHIGEVQTNDEVSSRLQYNGAIDALTSFAAALACVGIVDAPRFREAFEAAILACADNL